MQVKHVWEYQTVFQTTFQEVEVDEVVMVPRLVRRRIQQAVAVPVTMPVFKTYCRYRLDTPVHVPAAASPVPASPVNFVHAQQEEEPEIVFKAPKRRADRYAPPPPAPEQPTVLPEPPRHEVCVCVHCVCLCVILRVFENERESKRRDRNDKTHRSLTH